MDTNPTPAELVVAAERFDTETKRLTVVQAEKDAQAAANDQHARIHALAARFYPHYAGKDGAA